MATVVAIRGAGSLSGGIIHLSDCCPKPRVFSTIRKEGICACVVETTFTNCAFLGLGQSSHVKTLKDALTHLGPELHFKKWRSHRILPAWDLEPAILSAVLVGPLTTGSIEINVSLRKFPCIVIRRIHSSHICTKSSNSIENFLVSWVFILQQQLTQRCSVSVLNTFNENVSIVEHKVIWTHTRLSNTFKECFNYVRFSIIF